MTKDLPNTYSRSTAETTMNPIGQNIPVIWEVHLKSAHGAQSSLELRKSLSIDATFTGLQAALHLGDGSINLDRSAAVTSEVRITAHFARPGDVLFNHQRRLNFALLRCELLGVWGRVIAGLLTN